MAIEKRCGGCGERDAECLTRHRHIGAYKDVYIFYACNECGDSHSCEECEDAEATIAAMWDAKEL